MNKSASKVFVSCCLLWGCAASEDATRGNAPMPDALAEVGASASVREVQLVRSGDDPAQHALRVRRFGKLLLGDDADDAVLERAVRASSGIGAAVDAAAAAPAALRVTRLERNDDTLVVHGAVADDRADCEDVGEQGARAEFERVVSTLQAEGAPEVQGLDLEHVQVTRLTQGAGRLGDARSMHARLQQYIFSAPRVVDQVPISDSSLSVGVHRRGALASIRSTGVVASPRADARRGSLRPRRASTALLQERVEREFPGAGAHWIGLRYIAALRDASGSGGSSPHEVYLVFPPLNGAEGRSRGVRVAYSVTDPSAPAIYLDKASTDDKGDRRL